jgi:hypothetical protein
MSRYFSNKKVNLNPTLANHVRDRRLYFFTYGGILSLLYLNMQYLSLTFQSA